MEKNNNKEPKKIYIFGNELLGFHGHIYDKHYAERIAKTRKNLKMFKIKNNKFCRENLSVNTEFIELYDDLYMTANEEEYYIESFGQFQIDVLVYIDDLLENIKYFNFSNEEKYFIDYLITYLLDYKEYIKHGQYEQDPDEEECEIFDNRAAMEWFIKNVLDA